MTRRGDADIEPIGGYNIYPTPVNADAFNQKRREVLQELRTKK